MPVLSSSVTGWRGHHERLSRGQSMAAGSNRSFGIAFAVVFSVIGLLPLPFGGVPRWWAVGIAGALLLAAVIKPTLLAPFNWLWYKVRLLLHRIIAPLALAVLFYGVVTPTGLIMRMLGKDLLNRRYDRSAVSYWIHRESPGPEPESMKNQF